MSHRLAKVNKHIQRLFGEILQTEVDLPPDVLVTVTRVDVTRNLASAEIFLSVYPLDQVETILTLLRSQIYELQGALNRRLDARPLPRIRLTPDYGPAHADTIDQAFKRLND
jgi:ribosome-binding factor A